MNKMTYVQALEIALTKVDGEALERLTALRDQLMKRNASTKPTKTQEVNVDLKNHIVEVLRSAGSAHTVTELQERDALLGDLSNQKVSALLRQLVAEGKVVKSVEKRKTYFALAE